MLLDPRSKSPMVSQPHKMVSTVVIGLDFDNTLVSYDDLMLRVAIDRGLVPAGGRQSKRQLRDRIRQLPDGEAEWQKLQAVVYGPRMHEALPIRGVATFFQLCKRQNIPLFIASHKTRYAHLDTSGTDLRQSALDRMNRMGFFDSARSGLTPGNVYFESTRREKAERIGSLGCTHFIDDLEEMFLDESFPSGVEKILYAPDRPSQALPSIKVMSSWKEIRRYFFGTNR